MFITKEIEKDLEDIRLEFEIEMRSQNWGEETFSAKLQELLEEACGIGDWHARPYIGQFTESD